MFDISINREKQIIYLSYNRFLQEVKHSQGRGEETISKCKGSGFSILLDFSDTKRVEGEDLKKIEILLNDLSIRGMTILTIVSVHNECLWQMQYLLEGMQDKNIRVSYYKGWDLAKECIENQK